MSLTDTINHHIDEELLQHDFFSLERLSRADLMEMCRERGLPTEPNKKTLIFQLMQWKVLAIPHPVDPSSPNISQTEPHSSRGSHNGVSRASTEIGAGLKRVNSRAISKMLIDQDDAAEIEIPFEKLTYGRKLGSGGFKDCFAGILEGEPVAIGELRINDFSMEEFKEIKHEISVLKQLRHDNIVRFIGICTASKHVCIITELCENGDLYEFMRKSSKPGPGQLVNYMYDIAFGVSYLHARRPSIIHRDLKSMNILISKDLKMKITDFGLARIRQGWNTKMHTQCGTPNWQAPEMWVANPSYTEKVDVYSCGLIFWEILQWGAEPFPYHDLTEHQLYVKVRDHNVRPPMTKNVMRYPEELRELITDMWQGDPSKRPSMATVVERLTYFLD